MSRNPVNTVMPAVVGIDSVLMSASPRFSPTDAVRIADQTFGLRSVSARDLGSERDQSFVPAATAGQPAGQWPSSSLTGPSSRSGLALKSVARSSRRWSSSGHALGYRVVAEGVEELIQAKRLRAIGVDDAPRLATRDVVVIGGGIAGLTAAWRLRQRDVVLLEASDRVGGRMRSDDVGDYWLNYGAHLFPAPGSLVDAIATELGLEMVPVWGSMMGLAVRGAKLASGPVESYPFRLPLSVRDRVGFALRGLKIQRAVAAYHRAATSQPGETPAETRARVLAFEDTRTFGDFLGSMSPEVEAIFACASHRATAELDELSAGCGVGLFALVWGGKGSLIARNMLGGTGRLPAAISDRLGPDRVRVGARATSIRDDSDGLQVEYVTAAGPRRLRARHVILAVQAPFAEPLAQEVAPAAAAALGQMRYGAFLNVALATTERTAMPWDAIYAMATPGRAFDMFTNQAHALRRAGPRRPGGSLMLFAGGHHAAALSEEPDAVIVRRFIDDLVGLFPEASGVIGDALVQRWPLGNVFARPGRRLLQQPLEGALGEGSKLHLAGDYFAELGNLEAAARTGAAAAARVDRFLSGVGNTEAIT